MTYKDMTFCISLDCKNACGRQLTKEVLEAADKWYGQGEGKCPIAMSLYCGKEINKDLFDV